MFKFPVVEGYSPGVSSTSIKNDGVVLVVAVIATDSTTVEEVVCGCFGGVDLCSGCACV